MSLRQLIQRPLPVTAPPVLNPLMARMAEAAGFPAGHLGGGSTAQEKPDWSPVEKDMLSVIGLEKLLAIERATVEKGRQ
jgi:hypothetical protein